MENFYGDELANFRWHAHYLRVRLGLALDVVGLMAGLNASTVASAEGKIPPVRSPNLATAVKLAKVYGVTVAAMLADVTEEERAGLLQLSEKLSRNGVR